MSDIKNQQSEPLCRFGPGGDFVSSWTPENHKEDTLLLTPLMKIAKALSEMIVAILNAELIPLPQDCLNTENSVESNRPYKPKSKFNMPISIKLITTNRSDRESTLFSSGEIVNNANKPAYHTKTGRRTGRKKSFLKFYSQRTLFGSELKGVKTA